MKDEPKRNFVQWPPTSWLDPVDITRTGLQTFLAGLFGSFADKREVIAALYPENETFDYSKDEKTKEDRDQIWFDYICDTGDGWNPTYSIAYLVGQDKLEVAGSPMLLPRGHFMVLGGDQVYPVASSEQYRDRFEGPFFAARATTADEEPKERTPVFALPGNHDWYDGLTSFIRLFCRKGRWVGQWGAVQSRSYFAIQLPHGWWVWGLDLQLESDLDGPQVDYFKECAKQLKDNDSVILVSPEPTWIEAGRVDPKKEAQLLASADKRGEKSRATEKSGTSSDIQKNETDRSADSNVAQSHRNMMYVERLIRGRGASIPIKIAGDLHHYARYLGKDGNSQLITCGGGGAFLHGTYGLPKALDLQDSTGQAFFHEISVPSEDASKKMRRSVMWKLFQNNKRFALAVGIIYWVYSWLLQSASEALDTLSWKLNAVTLLDYLNEKIPALPEKNAATLLDYLRTGTCPSSPCPILFKAWLDIILRDPLLFFFTLLIILGCGFFAWSFGRPVPRWKRWCAAGFGCLHGAAHIALALVLIYGAAQLCKINWLVHFLTLPIGFLPGTLLMAGYLWLSNVLFGGHDQEVLSTQAIQDYKCFARFHVTEDLVTIYPIGLEKVCQEWKLAKHVEGSPPKKGWRGQVIYRDLDVPKGTKRIFEPVPDDCLKPRLLEKPIEVRRPVRTATGSPSRGSRPGPE
jgi:hypothetical protein